MLPLPRGIMSLRTSWLRMNGPWTFTDHVRNHRLTGVVLCGNSEQESGVVHQDVYRAVCLVGCLYQGFALVRLGDVGRDRRGLSTGVTDGLHSCLQRAGQLMIALPQRPGCADDLAALRGEHLGDRFAYAPAGAGHDNDSSIQPAHDKLLNSG